MVAHACLGAADGAGPLLDGLRDPRDLEVSIVVDHPGEGLAGGIWRLDHPRTSTFVFPTSLRLAAARAAVGAEAGVPALDPGFLADAATGVTLVSATAAGAGGALAGARDIVEGMLARCLAAELMGEVDALPPSQGEPLQ
jgi:hypothetical protein